MGQMSSPSFSHKMKAGDTKKRRQKVNLSYKHTLTSGYIGYVVQAINNTLAPLLFLTINKTYGISLEKISLLISINFALQMCIDLLSTPIVSLIGYRASLILAHVFSVLGLVSLGTLPELFENSFLGLLIAYVFLASGGGLIEVLVSPMIEACPTENKSAQMSILHSTYCWGQVAVVLLSTLFFSLCGIENWRLLAMIWAIIPAFNSIYLTLVPIYRLEGEQNGATGSKKFIFTKGFLFFIILMVCAGAAENSVSQWASAFVEAGLSVNKTVGDLLGLCLFAVLMGTMRAAMSKLIPKFGLERLIAASALLCVISYLLTSLSQVPWISLIGCGLCGISVAVMWPGTYSLASERYPCGGTLMFALLALAGDIGCMAGPSVVGIVSENNAEKLGDGILAAIIFPALMLVCFTVKMLKNAIKNAIKKRN